MVHQRRGRTDRQTGRQPVHPYSTPKLGSPLYTFCTFCGRIALLPSPPFSERRMYCVARRLCVCVRRAATARRISLGGEGNAMYPVLSSFYCRVRCCLCIIRLS